MLSSSSEGHTDGLGVGKTQPRRLLDGISHGHIAWYGNTATPRLEIAVCIAISSTRGICSGCETSSQ